MTNSEVWSHYKAYTTDITEFTRKLGFAGAGICWVLKSEDGTFPEFVLLALGFFVLFFVTDVLQGFVAAISLKGWIEKEEKKIFYSTKSIEGEYLKPKKLDRPAFVLFIIKIILILFGFGFISFAILRLQFS